MSEVEEIFAPNGAMEAFLMAREEGLIRFIGFSAHTEEAAIAMMERFRFDSVLFPFNYVCWHQGKFGPAVVKKAQEKGAALLGLKALARRTRTEDEERRFPKCWYRAVESTEEAEMALRFALSLPLTSAVSTSEPELLWWQCDAAEKFKPLSDAEAEEVRKKSEGLNPIFPQ
jgi:predicted aldo/keto reductase-like oxidoreductase